MRINSPRNVIVIGQNPAAYAFVFDRLSCALENRITAIQAKLQKSKNENAQSFCKKDPWKIINEYLRVPDEQRSKNPLYWHTVKLTEQIASAYLLSRFIGSSVNANLKQNTFKSCFSNNWDCYRKALLNKTLSDIEETEVSRHIGNALYKLDYRKILSQTGFDSSDPKKAEAAVLLVVSRLAKLAKKVNPQEFNASLFSGDPQQVMTSMSTALLQACEFIRKKGGAIEYLKFIDKMIQAENLSDAQKVKVLADEVKANVKWFGEALSRDFFKEMGYGIFSKPDVHVMNLIARLNMHLFYEWGTTDEERATFLLSEIAKAASTKDRQLTANQVDKIFWLLKSGNFHLHRLPKKYRLSDKQCIEICLSILLGLQNKGICSAVSAS